MEKGIDMRRIVIATMGSRGDVEPYIALGIELKKIGYDVIVPVTEDMLIPVREGSYKLRINKGVNSGYKNIVVTRDEETEVSLKELQIE